MFEGEYYGSVDISKAINFLKISDCVIPTF